MLMLTSPNAETVVHYIDEYVAILYTPADHEIVGLQVEDFESVFIPKYNALQKVWKLSDTNVKRGNVWDLTLAAGKKQFTVALEVVKAAELVLGLPAQALERALAYA